MLVNSIGTYRPAVGTTSIRTANTVPQSYQGYQENQQLAFGMKLPNPKTVGLTLLALLGLTITSCVLPGCGGGPSSGGPSGPGPTPPPTVPTVGDELTSTFKAAGMNVNGVPGDISYIEGQNITKEQAASAASTNDVSSGHTITKQLASQTNDTIVYNCTDYDNAYHISAPFTETYTYDKDAKVLKMHKVTVNGFEYDYILKAKNGFIEYYHADTGQFYAKYKKLSPGTIGIYNETGTLCGQYSSYTFDGQLASIKKALKNPKEFFASLKDEKVKENPLAAIAKHDFRKGELKFPLENRKFVALQATDRIAKNTAKTLSHMV